MNSTLKEIREWHRIDIAALPTEVLHSDPVFLTSDQCTNLLDLAATEVIFVFYMLETLLSSTTHRRNHKLRTTTEKWHSVRAKFAKANGFPDV